MVEKVTTLTEWQRRAAALSPDSLNLLLDVIDAARNAERLQAVLAAADPDAKSAVYGVLEALKEERNT